MTTRLVDRSTRPEILDVTRRELLAGLAAAGLLASGGERATASAGAAATRTVGTPAGPVEVPVDPRRVATTFFPTLMALRSRWASRSWPRPRTPWTRSSTCPPPSCPTASTSSPIWAPRTPPTSRSWPRPAPTSSSTTSTTMKAWSAASNGSHRRSFWRREVRPPGGST